MPNLSAKLKNLLLTNEQREKVILVQLGMDTTRNDVQLKYNARYSWDFCVKRIHPSLMKVTVSVFLTDKRFKSVLRGVHKAIHEVRQGQLMIKGSEREVVLKGTKDNDLSLSMKLEPELSRILRQRAYEAGFHATVTGVKKFLEKEYM
ncbi:hypothetical protein LCGC14_2807910 [marine sediment metagenome]|uniref:Uncharacterized protein n=1 Tax=marine sediment metagenome TaxID=412755 RepID=A0A0F8Z7L2_9ZZZZ